MPPLYVIVRVHAKWFKNRGHVDISEFRKINDTLQLCVTDKKIFIINQV